MYKFILLVLLTVINISAFEPISPIPLESGVDIKKAKLGMKLFSDSSLSRDNSTSCLRCHDIYNGGADTNKVSFGFENQKGNIQSPTVFNARYNFKQFWNGRANNLLEQADGPMNNPAEHNMDSKSIEERMNDSKVYKNEFKEVYDVEYITYDLVLDAIVEFEKALITPNAKFDKFLRQEMELSKDEKEGYKLFKQYGCISCHNGINIGGNSFQKMGTFLEYKSAFDYPDRSKITKKKMHVNVFKVPSLRNVNMTKPYFHDGSVDTLQNAIATMAKHNLGIKLSDKEISQIHSFLKTLDGEKPKILDEK